MKKQFLLFMLLSGAMICRAAIKDTTIYYPLPDSVKAISFMADITPSGINKKNWFRTGIKTDAVSLSLSQNRLLRSFEFYFPYPVPVGNPIVARGKDVYTGKKEGQFHFVYPWKEGTTYRLLIAMASDSAENFSLYSGYIWLPESSEWKLIGSCKIGGRWNTLQQPASFTTRRNKNMGTATIINSWCQRNTGSWKLLSGKDTKPPVVNLFHHTDSLYQWEQEKIMIERAIQSGTMNLKANPEGIYYEMMKEGQGKTVSVNDTVTLHYKGYLFSNGAVFDQSKEKPAVFPLKRLIRGWQIGVPLCKTGGKIKLVIPSGLAYSIRTRAAKIPPNSILVFEIEVLDTRAGQVP